MPFNLLGDGAFPLATQNRVCSHGRHQARRVLHPFGAAHFVAVEPLVRHAYCVLVRRHFHWVEAPIVCDPVNHVAVVKGEHPNHFCFKVEAARPQPGDVSNVTVGEEVFRQGWVGSAVSPV